ncbi:MAG: hypothetical protein FWC00_02315 [Firmicutes bacterium]|nr:hypothetical protein [Bacillota bacterium]
MDLIEIIGFVAGAVVLISFLFKEILLIRSINIVGSLGFVVYAVLVGAWSVLALNAALAVLQVVYITKHLMGKKSGKNCDCVIIPPCASCAVEKETE